MTKEIFNAYLAHYFKGKTIESIDFFQINEPSGTSNSKAQWLFDAGIQLDFNDELFCIAWHTEEENFTWSDKHDAALLLDDAPYFTISTEDTNLFDTVIGSPIVKAEITSQGYKTMDENGNVDETELYVPYQLLFELENGKILQIATVEYDLEDGKRNYYYSFFRGEVLVTIDSYVEIENRDN